MGKLRQLELLTRAGGSSGISSIADQLPDVANVLFYADEVKKASTGRDLAYIGRNLQDKAIDPSRRLDVALTALSDVTKDTIRGNEARVGDIAADIFQNVLNGNGKYDGIRLGFPALDEALDGINKDDFIVIGARPGVGKSAFTLQCAMNIAKTGKKVLCVSPEMSKQQLVMRALSIESKVPYMAIKRGNLAESDLAAVRDAKDKVLNLPLIIDDTATQTIESTRLQARRMQASGGIDLLMVDYLQLLCAGDDSKEAVTIVSKGLKAIAKDLHIPVWGVTQLSRQIEYRDDKRPRLSDIRGSGQVEQDADAILFIYVVNKSESKVEVFIEKNRNGPLGLVMLKFDKKTTKFNPYEKSSEGEW
jgi:replicative DNA helicase